MLGIKDSFSRASAAAQCSLRSCAAAIGGQGKLIYFINFPWLPVEAALSIFNVSLFVFCYKKIEKLLKIMATAFIPSHTISKNRPP